MRCLGTLLLLSLVAFPAFALPDEIQRRAVPDDEPPVYVTQSIIQIQDPRILTGKPDLLSILPPDRRQACGMADWRVDLARTLGNTPFEPDITLLRSCADQIAADFQRSTLVLSRLGTLTLSPRGVPEAAADPRELWNRDTPDDFRALARAAGAFGADGVCSPLLQSVQTGARIDAGSLQQCRQTVQTIAVARQSFITQHASAVQSFITSSGPMISVTSTSVSPVATLSSGSWESIVIDALVDQMVVQIRGAAAAKLLRFFGDSICRMHGDIDVASFFPDSCNLIRNGAFDKPESIAQLPAEFQRTLRNDLETLLPALMTMARDKDDAIQIIVPALAAVRRGNDPWVALSGWKCTVDLAQPLPTDRSCVTIALVGTIVSGYQACAGDQTCIERLPASVAGSAAFTTWRAVYQNAFVPEIAAFIRVLTAEQKKFAGSPKDALARAQLALALWRGWIEAGLPASARTEDLRKIARAEAFAQRWGSVGRAVYHVARNFRKGFDPIQLIEAEALKVKCTSPDDIGCGVGVAALTFTRLRVACEAERAVFENPNGDHAAALRRIVNAVSASLQTAIDALPHGDPLRDWFNHILPNIQNAGEKAEAFVTDIAPPFVSVFRGIIRAREIQQDTARPIAERDAALAQTYAQMALSIFDVWAITIGHTAEPDDKDRARRLITTVGTCWRAAEEQNYLTLAGSLYSLSLDLGIGRPLPEAAERYRPLITNLATARNEQEFRAALDSFLTSNSNSFAKFEHRASISLAGMPGMSRTRIGGTDSTTVFAPVGVDLFVNPSIPWLRTGVFVSLLDLGNLVALRLEEDPDDELETETSAKLRDVFAPGLYFRFPLRRSGFSVGAGASWINVRTTGDDGTDNVNRERKTSVFVSYDLTWLNFWYRK